MMKQQEVMTRDTTTQAQRLSTTLSGWCLLFARTTWIVVAGLGLAVCLASFPNYVTSLQLICRVSTGCASIFTTPDAAPALQGIGLSLGEYITLSIVLTGIETLLSCALGCLLFWRKSDDFMVLLTGLLLFLLGTNNTLSNLTDQPSFWQLPARIETWAFVLLVFLVLALFPNGRFVPRWTIVLVSGFGAIRTLALLFPSTHLHTGIQQLADGFWFAGLACLLGAQFYRYRRASSQIERQQTKWVIFAIAVIIVCAVGFAFPLVLSFFLPAPSPGSLYSLLMMLAFPIVVLLLPLSLSIAVLRYRLWDIDILINRTLVYGTLTVSIVSIYVLAVGYLGALFRTGSNLLLSLVAAGLVAVLFQPLRELLQRGANRLLYGQRDEPYTVITSLSRRLEATLASDAVLPTIVETVAQALKLPYAAIRLKQGDEFSIVASYGDPKGESLAFPLTYQRETIGKLLLAPRAPGEDFPPADRRLLNELVRQASLAAHAVRLTADLQRSNAHLQVARTHLVTAREEERRRLRRDLHDGLGPTLAALNLQAGAVQALIPQDPEQATAQVKEWRVTLRVVIADIRRLVYELRPPALDELGLVGAIREQAAQYSTQAGPEGVRMTVEAPDALPSLPAAVEVAAYRITQEALANVVRHAQAHTCRVHLWLDEALHVEISDNGLGLPEQHGTGVGLLSMRERAEELGGSCTIEPAGTFGTRVCVWLPLPKE